MARIWKLLLAVWTAAAVCWLAASDTVVAQAPITPPVEEESPLLREPTTPTEQFRAVLLMLRLGRTNLARMYLQKLVESQPDDAALLGLREEHGPAVFLRLSSNRELQPLSTQLLEQITAAFLRHASDPARIDALVADLGKEPYSIDRATQELQEAGVLAVPRLLIHLANAEERPLHENLVLALGRIGQPAVAPLLGALDSPSDLLRTRAIEALSLLQAREAVPYLWHPAFAEQQPPGEQAAARAALARILFGPNASLGKVTAYGAADELQRIALSHFRGEHPWKLDDARNVEMWAWSPDAETVAKTAVSPEVASAYLAARFARQARGIAPERGDLHALALATSLGLMVRNEGLGVAGSAGEGGVPDVTLAAGGELAGKALEEALRSGNSAAALGAIRVLSRAGSSHQVTRSGSAPLVDALNSPDTRVQFEAAVAILEIDPPTPFASSERIVAILSRALSGGGAPRAVVIDASVERATAVASFLRNAGYEPQVARTGRQGFEAAATLGGVELVAVHANVIRWELSQTIANFRADARTASVPIVIFGPLEMERNVAPLLRRTKKAAYVEESITDALFLNQLQPFLAQVGPPATTPEQRQAQRDQAAYWLAFIAGGNRAAIYNLAPSAEVLTQAALEPALSSNALLALSAIPTAAVQRTLHGMAVGETLDVGMRRAAAQQLAFHIQRHGVLLTKEELHQLQQSWTAAGEQELANALASVLGAIRNHDRPYAAQPPEFPAPVLPLR